jgi:phage terminase large subunit
MQQVTIRLPHNWAPRPYQRKAWRFLTGGGRRASLVWHRRAGKDDLCLHYAAYACHERVGGVWHMLPEAAQARKAIWLAVNPKTGKRRIDEAFPPEIRLATNDQEMLIRFKNGSTWQVVGSDNYDSLVGSSPIGIVFSEFAVANPSAWAYLRPIVLENDGWAVFISTPRGKNHFYNLHQQAMKGSGWFAETLTNKETSVFSPEQLDGELRELQNDHGETYGKSLWLQEYFCSFEAAIPGSIWGDCLDRLRLQERIGAVPHDPDFPVSTAWDLGRTDDTAIWFYQMVAGEIRVIDYHASSFKEIPYYADLLREKMKAKWTFGTHWLPHDARPRRLGMGGKSILQQLQDQNVGRFVIVPRLDVQEGIQAARATFPKCFFDAEKCDAGLQALRHYHREWDDEAKKFRDSPEHDWSSHAADAFRYLSLSWRNPKSVEPSTPLHDRLMKGNPVGQNFGQLKKQHFSRMRAARELH